MKEDTFECVWDALANSPSDAVSLRLKSDIITAIRKQIRYRLEARSAITQRLQIDDTRLTELLEGRIDRFLLDDLISIATASGLEVRLHVALDEADQRF